MQKSSSRLSRAALAAAALLAVAAPHAQPLVRPARGAPFVPVHEVARLTPSDTIQAGNFGIASAITDGVLLVGAPGNDDFETAPTGGRHGAAHVYERDPVTGAYAERARLYPSVFRSGGTFGTSVALTPATAAHPAAALVGAFCEGAGPVDCAGAAYVFERNPATGAWRRAGDLYPVDRSRILFGSAVALDAGRALVGAPGHASADLFERDPASGAWVRGARLLREGTRDAGSYGKAVALAADVALVSAWITSDVTDDPFSNRGGAVHVFERDPATDTWTQRALWRPLGSRNEENFGRSVAALAPAPGTAGAPPAPALALVGSPFRQFGEGDDASFPGSVTVFERDPASGAWARTAEIVASDGQSGDWFGWAVAASHTPAGVLAVVTAGAASYDGLFAAGAAYAFLRDPATGTWTEVARMTPSDAEDVDYFGDVQTVGVSPSGRAVVGVPSDSYGGGVFFSGSAHVFDLGPLLPVGSASGPPVGRGPALSVVGASPASRRTAFGFALGAPGTARLVVTDALGREVARPADGVFGVGAHRIGLDVSRWPAGVYVARLTTAEGAATVRLVVVR